MSRIVRFSFVGLSLLMMSKRDFESGKRYTCTESCNLYLICDFSARASSSKSANVKNSAERTERATFHDLKLLKMIGIAESELSINKMVLPSCDFKPALFAKAASEYPTIRALFNSILVNLRLATLMWGYRIAKFRLFQCAQGPGLKRSSIICGS